MMELMNNVTKGEAKATKPKYEVMDLPLEKIIPNPGNLYSLEGIDELADSILLAGKVLQNIVVKAADESGRYMIISGHRRHLACKKLVEAGHTEFDVIPALVENEADENLQELMLIYTNSTSRVLSDAEKMYQAQRATELLKKLKAEGKFTDRVRDTVARMLNTTSGQLARYAAIAKNLTNPELKEAFETGELGVSAAYEASGLSEEGQEEVAAKLTDSGKISLQDVSDVKEREREPERFSKGITNSENLPMQVKVLKIPEEFKAAIRIFTVEKDGKFYSSSDGTQKTGGWGSYPSTQYGKSYDTEQEAIDAEIYGLARRNEELHQVLWESGYHFVGEPAAEMQQEEPQQEEIRQELPEPAENDMPAEDNTEQIKPLSAEEIQERAKKITQSYAYETVTGELAALRDSYAGAAERHKAMGGDNQGEQNLKTTAEYFQRLINCVVLGEGFWEQRRAEGD